MSSETQIHALEKLGRQLDEVAARRRRRRRPRVLVALAFAGALGTAPALAATGAIDLTGFDFGADMPRTGEPGGPPAVVEEPNVPTVNVLETLIERPDGVRELRQRVEPYGLRVRVAERPVAPAAVGRLFGVQFPREARFDRQQRLVLERGSRGTIIASIGVEARSGERVQTEGLSLYEVLPQVERVVRRDDPGGTLERLQKLGFSVAVKFVIDNPDRGGSGTGVKDVALPPEGTVVLSILNADGENAATPQTRSLIMEVAPADAEVARSHP